MEQTIDDLNNEIIELRQYNDDLTTWLVRCCEILYNSSNDFDSVGLRQWFLEYKLHQEKVESNLMNIIEQKTLRQRALDKLSPEEKKALGVFNNPNYKGE